jgi:NAD-dependent SIR2 family protein deacetylase
MSDDSCPYCKNEKLLYGFNGVAQTDAEAITEWIDEDVDPYEIFASSSIRVDWKCEACSGIYREPINKHLKDYYDNVNDCPYCNNRKALAELNTLDTILDDVEDIWSDTNEKHYTELLPTSSYRAEWKCNRCGGKYNEYVRDFVEKHLKGEDECPYCMGKRPLLGYNTLKTANPDWLSEWSYQNNYLLYEPDDILPNHGGDVWWKCGKCGYDYPMSPKDRYIYEKRHKISCPKCKGLRRKKKYFF